jgi:hypothetical protein
VFLGLVVFCHVVYVVLACGLHVVIGLDDPFGLWSESSLMCLVFDKKTLSLMM